MATKVYLSGDLVFVDQTTTPLLKIPQRLAKFILINTSTTDADPLDQPISQSCKVINTASGEYRVDDIASIQDVGGTPYGDSDDVNKALQVFISISGSDTVFQGAASSGVLVGHKLSVANSTSGLLGAAATFTGVFEDTTLYATTAVSIAGSNATDGTLYIEASSDGVTVETSVPYQINDASLDFPKIWNNVEQYIRIRYVNGTTPQTTFFDITTKYSNTQQLGLSHNMGDIINAQVTGQIVKAVLSGIDPDGIYHNVNTTRGGNLDISISDPDAGFFAIVTPGGSLKVAEQTHLIGAPFGDAALSTDKWSIDLVASGTQDATGVGELTMDTGITLNSAVEIESIDVARFIPANYNTTHHAVTIPDGASYAADNSRKWGAFEATDAAAGNGIYFELDSGVWYTVHCKNGVATRTIQGSWNGAGAATFPTNSVTANVYEIEYNAGSIIYRVNGNIIHRDTLLTVPYANDIHFPVGMSNTNKNGSTTNVSLKLRAAAIFTLGKGFGSARPVYITSTTVGQLIKDGPGRLEKVIFARTGGGGGDAVIELYDALSATNQVGRIAIGGDDTVEIDYGFTTNVGLYVVITGSGTLGTTITFD